MNIGLISKLRLISICLALLACSFATDVAPTATPVPMTPPTETPKPEPTITSTPFYELETDRTISLKSGGFSFDHIRGYDIYHNDSATTFMANSDETVQLFLMAYTRPRSVTIGGMLNSILEDYGHSYQSMTHTDPVKKTDGDVGIVSADFTAQEQGEPVQGRLTIYEPGDSKLLLFFVIAHGDQRWDREGEKAFEITRDSIKFFPITARPDCPVTKYSRYGKWETMPIQIGGGKTEGPDRIENYLNVLLGPDGQIIYYYRLLDQDQNIPDLVQYAIEYDNTLFILYFDVNNYEAPVAPLGMKCSAPFPGNP